MFRAIWYHLYKILKTWKKHPWGSATFVLLLLLLFCSSYISDNTTKIQENTTVFSYFVNIFFLPFLNLHGGIETNQDTNKTSKTYFLLSLERQ